MGSGGPISTVMASSAAAFTPSWTWVVPLIVGVIALGGTIATAWISSNNTKKQIASAYSMKIAEMRQAWINNLRDAMASFQSYGITPGLEHRKEQGYYEKGTKIELLMNPKDPDYAELKDCLDAFWNAQSDSEKSAADPKFVTVCQRILKREWVVLKKQISEAAGGKISN